ncbi:MAG: ImmA/IrrE family metallo-endopeptidase [Caldilineaceae bacterium]|nr:ImmA/IrrE family metallo-endopeptidase [Caldilineaceae bacterium]
MRRGFKTEAKEIAREVRGDLGIGMTDPLDPWRLAEWLGIPVFRLSEFGGDAKGAFRQFSGAGRSVFSAVTVFDGNRRWIVHNDFHSTARQASNVCHELAHGLLLHPPTPALDDRGCRFWSKEIEDEANWLSGVLLVPDEAAIAVVKRGIDLSQAAEHYGVSVQMMRFRINVSGARKRAQRFLQVMR